MTDFLTVCKIFSELYVNHGYGDRDFDVFVRSNNIGIPLGYFYHTGILDVKTGLTSEANKYIYEAWENVLSHMGLVDIGFESWDEIESSEPDFIVDQE